MKINYNKNPLYTTVELTEEEKKELWYKIKIEILENKVFEGGYYLEDNNRFDIERARKILKLEYDKDDNNTIDKQCNEMVECYIVELAYGHAGDCTCNAFSCGKCQAETLLGIDTIEGLGKHSAYKIDNAFGKNNEKTIEEALDYLKNYNPTPTDPDKWERVGGYEQYLPRWKAEAKLAYDWLKNYSLSHF